MSNSARPPYMQHEYVENLGFTASTQELLANMKRIRMSDISWEKLLKAPISRTSMTRAEVTAALEGYRLVEETTDILAQDGTSLLTYIKAAIPLCFDAMGLGPKLKEAVDRLTKIYEPPVPKFDQRHRETVESELEYWTNKGMPIGVYHFAYWPATGRLDLPMLISSEARKGAEFTPDPVEYLLQQQAALQQAIGMWFQLLDPTTHRRYRDCYQALVDQDKLEFLHQSARGCFTGMALLINHAVNPHRDSNDVKDGYVVTTPLGDFEGGLVVFPDLKLMICQKPGDLLFSRSALLQHSVTDITAGQRTSFTYFTKRFVMELPVPTDVCQWCKKGYSSLGNLRQHWRTIREKHDPKVADDHDINELYKLVGLSTGHGLRRRHKTQATPKKKRKASKLQNP